MPEEEIVETKTEDKGEQKGAPAAKADPAPEKAPEKAKAAPEVKEEKPAKAKGEVDIADEDEIPSDAQLLKLTPGALNKRLDRFSRAQLREHFGTDDVSKIKESLAEYQELKAKQEEERRAQLTKEQKLEEDLQKEKAEKLKAQAQAKKAEDQIVYAEYDRVASSVIEQYFDPEVAEFAMTKLRAHVKDLDDDDVPQDAKGAKKFFDDWAKKYVEKNPRYAKPATESEEEKPAEKEKPKVGIQTAARHLEPPKQAGLNLANKTARPGQPNSMSKAEFAARKRQLGLS
jgi:hypothetical protein